MKTIKKSKLTFSNGYLLDKKGRIVNTIDVVAPFNDLIKKVERAMYDIDNHSEKEEFVSRYSDTNLCVDSVTPLLDEQVAKVKAIMEEIKAKEACEWINAEVIPGIHELADFIGNDVFLFDKNMQTKVKFIENPLEVNIAMLEDFLKTLATARTL